MARSFKLPKVVLKQKKDLDLPSFAWESISKMKKTWVDLAVLARCIWLHMVARTSQHVVVKKLKSVSIDSQTRPES